MSDRGVAERATKPEEGPDRVPGHRRAGDGAVVSVYEDGPLIVRGEFVIAAQDGRPIPAGRGTVALCRCGRSAIKPFCDGSHTRISFRAPGGDQRARAAAEDGGGIGGAWQPLPGVGDAAAQPAGQGEPAAD
jgi:CDGSH-type Zn-finger protein